MTSLFSVIFSRLAFIVTASLLITFLFVLGFTERFLTKAVYEDSASTIHFLSHNMEANYLRQLESLRILEANAGNRLPNANAIRALFKQFLDFDNIFNSLHYYTTNGDLLVAERRSSVPVYWLEKNVRDRNDKDFAQLVEEVIRTKRPKVTPTRYTSKGQPYQTYLVPHAAGGRVLGVLSGGIYLAPDQMKHLVAGVPSSGRHLFVIADGNGRTLLSNVELSDELAAVVANYHRAAITGIDSNGRFSSRGLAKSAYLFTTEKLPDLGFLVTYGVVDSFLKERRWTLTKLFGIALSLSLLLAFILTFAISRKISGSLETLDETLQRILIGDFTVRMRKDSHVILPSIGESVDRIAENLERDRTLGEVWSTEVDLKNYLDRS